MRPFLALCQHARLPGWSGNRCLVWQLICLGLASISTGCNPEPSGESNARPQSNESQSGQTSSGDATSEAVLFWRRTGTGLEFVYRNDVEAQQNSILESLGGGVGLLDFDQDGDLDVFLPGGGRFGSDETISGLASGLFRNESQWKFSDCSQFSFADQPAAYSHGASVADYDNDGFPDILVTGYGALALFRNQGDGTFESIARSSGLADSSWSSSAGWGDFNRDGSLDLYVAHYVDWSFQNNPFCPGTKPDVGDICSPQDFSGLPDVFYQSLENGRFEVASEAVGLILGGENPGKGLGVLVADVDLDGDPDIYVANDTVPNFLYRNQGNGTLEETGLSSGTAMDDRGRANGSMGVALTDFDRDGLPDLWAANFERESFALYRNMGNCVFLHVSRPTGITAVGGLYVGWGTTFFDLDRDADQDVFVSNGHVMYYPANAPVRQQPLVLLNEPLGQFEKMMPGNDSYLNESFMGRGVAAGDLDNDGDQDLVVSHLNDPVALLDNRHPNEHHWLSVRLIGRVSNRDAIGATVWVETDDGIRQMRQRVGSESYASSSDHRLFFGLAGRKNVTSIEILWPTGKRQRLGPLTEVDQVITVVEPLR